MININILLFLVGLLNLFLGLIVWMKNKKAPANIWYGLLVISGALWTFGILGFLYVNNIETAKHFVRFYYLIAALIAYEFLFFSIYFPFKKIKVNFLFRFITFIPVLFIIYFLYFTNYHFSQIIIMNWGKDVTLGSAYIFYVFYFTFYIVASFIIWLIKYREADKISRLKLKYVFIGTSTALIFGSFFNLFLPFFNYRYVWAGPFFTIIMFGFIFYAIIKYRLMNIRLVITRSVLYAILVGTVASFFALSVFIAGNYLGAHTRTGKILVYIFNSIILVLFLDPVKKVWAKVTDSIFYKDKINYQLVLQKAGMVMASEINLESLLSKLSIFLSKELKIKNVSIAVMVNNHLNYINGSSKKISLSKETVSYLENNKDIIILEELIIKKGEYTDLDSVEVKKLDKFIIEAEKNKAEMYIPVIENNKLNSILIVSSKNSGDLYNEEDINFFKVLAPQIATSIEKSKLYEEVEELNKELKFKVKEKTKSLGQANIALEKRNKFLSGMQNIVNKLSRILDLNKGIQLVVDSISSELGYVGGVLSFVNKDKETFSAVALTENSITKPVIQLLKKDPKKFLAQLDSQYNLGAKVIVDNKMYSSNKMSDFFCPPVDKNIIDKIQHSLDTNIVIGVPIISEGKVIGLIHFLLKEKKDNISSLDIETMTSLADQVGIIYRNLRLYDNLQVINKELQEANVNLRTLDKTKSEFLSIASHQLRTPVSAIKGYLSMILDGDFGRVPKKIKKVANDLFDSSSRLARLIDIFLNVSRIESGRLKLDKQPLDIDPLIKSVISELSNQANSKKLKLEYTQSCKKVPLILADSDKIRDVVLNLVDNAIKYTQKGKITLLVSCSRKILNFQVKDTGIGIEKDEVKTLFRKFVRGSGVAQIHTGGSGLGLFIAQKIIKEHGGKIWAESDGRGRGSVFQFILPVYLEKK